MKLTHKIANELLRDVTSTGIEVSRDAVDFMRIMWRTTKKRGSIELSDKQAGFFRSLRADADLKLLEGRVEERERQLAEKSEQAREQSS